MTTNIQRGLLRIFIIVSIGWLVAVGYWRYPSIQKPFAPEEVRKIYEHTYRIVFDLEHEGITPDRRRMLERWVENGYHNLNSEDTKYLSEPWVKMMKDMGVTNCPLNEASVNSYKDLLANGLSERQRETLSHARDNLQTLEPYVSLRYSIDAYIANYKLFQVIYNHSGIPTTQWSEYATRLQQLKVKARITAVFIAVAWFLLPLLVFYVFGLIIAWVVNGFKPTSLAAFSATTAPTPGQDAPPTATRPLSQGSHNDAP